MLKSTLIVPVRAIMMPFCHSRPVFGGPVSFSGDHHGTGDLGGIGRIIGRRAGRHIGADPGADSAACTCTCANTGAGANTFTNANANANASARAGASTCSGANGGRAAIAACRHRAAIGRTIARRGTGAFDLGAVGARRLCGRSQRTGACPIGRVEPFATATGRGCRARDARTDHRAGDGRSRLFARRQGTKRPGQGAAIVRRVSRDPVVRRVI